MLARRGRRRAIEARRARGSARTRCRRTTVAKPTLTKQKALIARITGSTASVVTVPAHTLSASVSSSVRVKFNRIVNSITSSSTSALSTESDDRVETDATGSTTPSVPPTAQASYRNRHGGPSPEPEPPPVQSPPLKRKRTCFTSEYPDRASSYPAVAGRTRTVETVSTLSTVTRTADAHPDTDPPTSKIEAFHQEVEAFHVEQQVFRLEQQQLAADRVKLSTETESLRELQRLFNVMTEQYRSLEQYRRENRTSLRDTVYGCDPVLLPIVNPYHRPSLQSRINQLDTLLAGYKEIDQRLSDGQSQDRIMQEMQIVFRSLPLAFLPSLPRQLMNHLFPQWHQPLWQSKRILMPGVHTQDPTALSLSSQQKHHALSSSAPFVPLEQAASAVDRIVSVVIRQPLIVPKVYQLM